MANHFRSEDALIEGIDADNAFARAAWERPTPAAKPKRASTKHRNPAPSGRSKRHRADPSIDAPFRSDASWSEIILEAAAAAMTQHDVPTPEPAPQPAAEPPADPDALIPPADRVREIAAALRPLSMPMAKATLLAACRLHARHLAKCQHGVSSKA